MPNAPWWLAPSCASPSSDGVLAYQKRQEGLGWAQVAAATGAQSAAVARGQARRHAKRFGLLWPFLPVQPVFHAHLEGREKSACRRSPKSLRFASHRTKANCPDCRAAIQEFDSRLSYEDIAGDQELRSELLWMFQVYLPVELPEEEWEDILSDALLSIFADGRGFPRWRPRLRTWVLRRAISQLRVRGCCYLTRNSYNLRSGGVQPPFQTRIDEDPDVLPTPHEPLEHVLDQRGHQQRLVDVVWAVVPGAAERYVRFIDRMFAGQSERELAAREGVSLNRARKIKVGLFRTLRRGRKLAADAPMVVAYIEDNPSSTVEDILEDLYLTRYHRDLGAPKDLNLLLRILVEREILQAITVSDKHWNNVVLYRVQRHLPQGGLFGLAV